MSIFSGEPERKGMDWYSVIMLGLILGVGVLGIVAPILTYQAGNEKTLDLNSQLTKLQQGQGVLFQGETELARMIQDINENITVNKQAMDWLTYLSESCTKLVDENNYINFRCRK